MWAAIDAYCERTSSFFWGEPANAISNLAFLLAAFVMWRRSAGLPMARAMCLTLTAIGAGSFLFHTHANGLTAGLDVAPILGFILIYVFAATRDLLGWRGLWPWGAILAFFPYAAATVPIFAWIGVPGSSAGYAPIPILILGYAVAIGRKAPGTGKGLAIGAVLLLTSLAFRTLDMPLCTAFPRGTHFLWHLLNAIMLGWLIEVYRRHLLAGPGAGG